MKLMQEANFKPAISSDAQLLIDESWRILGELTVEDDDSVFCSNLIEPLNEQQKAYWDALEQQFTWNWYLDLIDWLFLDPKEVEKKFTQTMIKEKFVGEFERDKLEKGEDCWIEIMKNEFYWVVGDVRFKPTLYFWVSIKNA